MTRRTGLKQSDIERIIRAARNAGASVHIDMKTAIATLIPTADGSVPPQPMIIASEAKEEWDFDL